MDQIWQELTADFPTFSQMVTVTFRLTLAAIAGALPGLQRERVHVAAGLRTHMLVSLGAAIFVLASIDAQASVDATTRVIQGLATGIGFVGAGAILKSSENQKVHGLTTASSIWLTAALGTAAGLGRVWLTLLGSVLSLIILASLRRFEQQLANHDQNHAETKR